MLRNTSSIKHGIDSILANNFSKLQSTPFSVTRPYSIDSSQHLNLNMHENLIDQLCNLNSVFPFHNFTSLRCASSTVLNSIPNDEVSDDSLSCIDIESLDECEEVVNQINSEMPIYDANSVYDDSDTEGEKKEKRNDRSYKCSNRRLNLLQSKKITRGNCGNDREFYMLQKEKGKPRGRTVKTSSGMMTEVEHKKRRTVGRPIKTPRGRNARAKRDSLIKEGLIIPEKHNVKPRFSKKSLSYKAVRFDVRWEADCTPLQQEPLN